MQKSLLHDKFTFTGGVNTVSSKQNNQKRSVGERILDSIAYAIICIGNFFKRLFAKKPKVTPELIDEADIAHLTVGEDIGPVIHRGGARGDSTDSAKIADAKRRHRAASASDSTTTSASSASALPRKRNIKGLDETKANTILTYGALGLIILIGAALVIAAFSAGGTEELIEVDNTQSTAPLTAVSETDVQATIAIGGGIKLHEEVLTAAKTSDGYDFNNYLSELKSVLKGDISIVNLHGHIDALGTNTSVAGYPKANYPYELSETLAWLGVTHANLSNTSALSGGWSAMSATRANLAQSGITPLGVYESAESSQGVYVTSVNTIKIGIGTYNCLEESDYTKLVADQTGAGVTEEQLAYGVKQLKITQASETILADVAKMREQGAEFLIIMLNWGSESTQSPTYNMRDLAQDLLDNGVNIIVGGGSNYTQRITKKESEYNKKDSYVFYSLGNLFSDIDSGKTAAYQQSMVLNFTIERKAGESEVNVVSAICHPIYVNRDSEYEEESTYLKYRVVPAAKYAVVSTRPSVFSTNAQWTRCKNVFSSVKSLSSGKLTLGSADFFAQSSDVSSSADYTGIGDSAVGTL